MKLSKMIQKRPKDTKGTLKRLWRTLSPFWNIIIAVGLLSLLSCVLSLLGPYFCGEAINEVEKGAGAIDFSLAIVSVYKGQNAAKELAEKVVYSR